MKRLRSPHRTRKPLQQPERALHAHVGQILAYVKPQCVYFPVPNGAADLGPKLGGLLKAQYKVHPGVSDWIFMWGIELGQMGVGVNEEGMHFKHEATCAAIELKSGTGHQDGDQKKFEAWCRYHGVPYVVCRSVEQVLVTLEGWGRLPVGTHKRIRGLE